MLDLHTHILPGLDDGARSIDESLAMARIALEDGITCLVATPHDLGTASDYPCRVRTRAREVKAALATESLDLSIALGSELSAVPDLVPRLREGRALTLGCSRYFLLEFPLHGLPVFAAHLVFEAQIAGLIPIVAHPARNVAIQRDPNELYALVERGALGQVTSSSLLGDFGPRVQATARDLLEHRLVHVIASDAHGADHRAPQLSAAVRVAAEVVGHEAARAMVLERPESILQDRDMRIEPPRPYRRRRRFWFL